MKAELGLDKVLRVLIFATGSAAWTSRSRKGAIPVNRRPVLDTGAGNHCAAVQQVSGGCRLAPA